MYKQRDETQVRRLCNYYYYTRLTASFPEQRFTTWVSQNQKGKTSLDLSEARDDGVWGHSGISWTILRDKPYNIKMQVKYVTSINEHVMMSSDQRSPLYHPTR